MSNDPIDDLKDIDHLAERTSERAGADALDDEGVEQIESEDHASLRDKVSDAVERVLPGDSDDDGR
jgi:hypothetical protein